MLKKLSSLSAKNPESLQGSCHCHYLTPALVLTWFSLAGVSVPGTQMSDSTPLKASERINDPQLSCRQVTSSLFSSFFQFQKN